MSKDQDHLPARSYHLLILLAVVATATLCLVFPQLGFIRDWRLFSIIFFALLVLSFLASSIEAAIPLCDGNDKVDAALDNKEAKLVEAQESLDQRYAQTRMGKNPNSMRALSRERNRLDRDFERLYVCRSVLQGNRSREVYIGSLAAFSVFSNAGLAAFIPFAFTSQPINSWLAKFPIPDVRKISDWYFDNPTIQWDSLPTTTVDATSEKVFVFLIVSVPILLVGKILPKTMGQRNPVAFGYYLFPFATFAKFMLAWIVQGVRVCLPR